MIAGAELAGWVSDRARQLQTRAGMEALADRWSRHDLMMSLQRDLDSMPVKDAQSVLSAATRFIDRMDDIEALLSELIAGAKADPFFRPPFYAVSSEISTGLLLWDNPELSIALGVTGVDMLAAKKSGKRGPTSIGFTGLMTTFRFLKAGGATLSFWEAPEIRPGFVREESGKCKFVGRRALSEGETIVLDGRRESLVIEHAKSDVVYIQAVVRVDAAPLSVEYDSETLDYVGAASTDEESSRTQMMVTLLRMMDRRDALPLIEQSLASPHFYTRWHVMREYLAMDAEAALPSLRQMAAADPHPEVRAAAQQTLSVFFDAADEQEKIACHA